MSLSTSDNQGTMLICTFKDAIGWFSRLSNILYVSGETLERTLFSSYYLILSLTNEYIHRRPLGSALAKISR